MFVLFYPCFSFRRPPIARTGKKDHGPVPQKPFRLITLYGGARKTVICCVPGVSDRRSDVIYLSCVFTEPDLRLPSQPANFLPNSLARSSAASLPVSACPCSSTACALWRGTRSARSDAYHASTYRVRTSGIPMLPEACLNIRTSTGMCPLRPKARAFLFPRSLPPLFPYPVRAGERHAERRDPSGVFEEEDRDVDLIRCHTSNPMILFTSNIVIMICFIPSPLSAPRPRAESAQSWLLRRRPSC